MGTTRSAVTFANPFILNRDVEELPAGNYEIETDEEEIPASSRSAFRRTAVYFYVNRGRSTRMLAIDPVDLESALSRDAESGAGMGAAETAR